MGVRPHPLVSGSMWVCLRMLCTGTATKAPSPDVPGSALLLPLASLVPHTLPSSVTPFLPDPSLAACLEEQHLTETKLRAAFDFFDRDATGRITQSDVVQVGRRACFAAGCSGSCRMADTQDGCAAWLVPWLEFEAGPSLPESSTCTCHRPVPAVCCLPAMLAWG